MVQKQQKSKNTSSRQQGNNRKQQESRKARRPHLLEWIIGGVSAVFILAVVGFVLFSGLTSTSSGAVLQVVPAEIEATGGSFRVTFRVVNSGDETAAAVEVEGVMEQEGARIETSRATIDYVPAHSRREGALLFDRDPREHRLELRAKGYADP